MSLLDIFKKSPKYWESYKNLLIVDCQLPFNVLLPLEDKCNAIMERIAKGEKNITVETNDEERMLLQDGIAAKAADAKYNVTILAESEENKKAQTEALAQWQPQDGTITIAKECVVSPKGKNIGINLFEKTDAQDKDVIIVKGK